MPELTDGFEASPYPIILSLEMHCSLEQQATIARAHHSAARPPSPQHGEEREKPRLTKRNDP